MHGLKPYIRDELELYTVSNLDKARRKAKLIEEKFKNSRQGNLDKSYLRQYKIKCGYWRDSWSPGHQCKYPKSYDFGVKKISKKIHQSLRQWKEKGKKLVVYVAKIRSWAINEEPITQHTEKL